jgi:peptidoglycan/xylan/chitin deacetylase (PgdA/CDA1 family)
MVQRVIKRVVKNAYSGALWHTGALAVWLRLRPGRRRPWILNYHHIGPKPFESHLQCLVRRYHVISLDACCRHVAMGEPVPPNSVVLTFDDGYEQLYHELYPLLERYRAPATAFVPTTPVDARQPLWFNRVKAFIRSAAAPVVRVGDREFPADGDREATYVAVMRHLNEQPVAVRDRRVAELLDGVELPADRMARHQPLTWEQMRAMRAWVTFGGHTRTHPWLSRLSRAEAEDEILGSKARLEEMLGVEVRHFAYPFGSPDSFTEETVAILRAGGFASAAMTRRGPCRVGGSPYRLPRILFDGSVGGRVVAARLSGLWVFLTT